jgi:hypothetical protein
LNAKKRNKEEMKKVNALARHEGRKGIRCKIHV